MNDEAAINLLPKETRGAAYDMFSKKSNKKKLPENIAPPPNAGTTPDLSQCVQKEGEDFPIIYQKNISSHEPSSDDDVQEVIKIQSRVTNDDAVKDEDVEEAIANEAKAAMEALENERRTAEENLRKRQVR